MINTLIGQKIEQTQKFLQNGRRIPVTEISLPDNAVVQVKTSEKDGYVAVQLGFGERKHVTRAIFGHVLKAKLEAMPAFFREVRLQFSKADDQLKVGDLISVAMVFKPGDIVAVTGTSKGKGFAGVVKRHGFRGGPKTHGQSDRERAPGSIGQTTTPGRVYRGKRMAGRMGTERVTVQHLQVVDIDPVKKLLSIMGLIPGHLKSIVSITKTGELKNFVPLIVSNEQSTVVEEKNEAPTQAPQIVEGA